ncbi:hypothetical protein BDF19DRAFT_434956 [Syncephalis fuscata]|nr:hypothetical protein BDF19DRAFT_434956 [Syncephalis fuscata]
MPPPLPLTSTGSHTESGYWIDPMTGMCISAAAPPPGAPFDPNMRSPHPPPPPSHIPHGHYAAYGYPYPMAPYGYPGTVMPMAGPVPAMNAVDVETAMYPMQGKWPSAESMTSHPISKSKLKASAPEFVPGQSLLAKQQPSSTDITLAPPQTPPLSASNSDYNANNTSVVES